MSGYLTFTRQEWLDRPGQPRSVARPDRSEPLTGVEIGAGSQDLQLAGEALVELLTSVAWLVSVRAAPADHRGQPAGGIPESSPRPFLVGMAGGVAVGKSTTARILRALLARSPAHPVVELVSTDGFLLPNADLAARRLLARKGFPESYDVEGLVRFLSELRAGRAVVSAPVYSHETYDVEPGRVVTLHRPDIVVVEGLNVLQAGPAPMSIAGLFDFTIYLDAAEADMERWYIERFVTLRDSVGARPDSFYQRFAGLGGEELAEVARMVWRTVNAVNLTEHIAPTRCRADLILEKGPDHAVARVRLRQP